MTNATKHPETAFQFRASAPQFKPAQEDESTLRKFVGVAYSGNALRHPYWGQVIFDLDTTQAGNPTPILINHDRNQRAGYATLNIDGKSIEITDGRLMLNTEYGRAVAEESDAGFPWQMSVHIEPGRIDEVKAGVKVEVNGQTITGPATIFRDNLIREVSFTPTGVDHNTSAAAMSADSGIQVTQPVKERAMPTIEELQAQIEELKASIKASNDAREAAEKRANDAEAALATIKREARLSAIKELFSAIGRNYTEEAAKPYIDMDDATFSAVSADMRALKPVAPSHLFSEHAISGADHVEGAETKFSLNPNDVYAARRMKK